MCEEFEKFAYQPKHTHERARAADPSEPNPSSCVLLTDPLWQMRINKGKITTVCRTVVCYTPLTAHCWKCNHVSCPRSRNICWKPNGYKQNRHGDTIDSTAIRSPCSQSSTRSTVAYMLIMLLRDPVLY